MASPRTLEVQQNNQSVQSRKGFSFYDGETYLGRFIINENEAKIGEEMVELMQNPVALMALLTKPDIDMRAFGSKYDVTDTVKYLKDAIASQQS